MRWSGGRTAWIAGFVSLFLVFVLPACTTGALIRASTEVGGTSQGNTNNEEREERESVEEIDAVRRLSRPPLHPPARPAVRIGDTSRAMPPRTLIAQNAPKPHPSRFSERRLR